MASRIARLILASGSPRRQALLNATGLRFAVIESGVDEQRRLHEPARDYSLRMAREKALAVSTKARGAIVLGADTVVECAGEILEKPVDEADARRMLTMLSGRTHSVVTAFALAFDGVVRTAEAVTSQVTFRRLGEAEIEQYVAGGEPLDKAGAYGIQGKGAEFIAGLQGSRDNVMGLPVHEVLVALEGLGIIARERKPEE